MPSIQELIAKARANTIDSELGRIDSLNNAYKITVLSESLLDTTGIDSTQIPPPVFEQAAENLSYFDEGGHEYTKEEWETFNLEERVPFKPSVTPNWSFSESPVGEELTGGKEGTKWFLNPNVSFREWYSDVGRGTGEPFTIFGQPVMGLGKSSVIYDPSGEPGEEKYNKKYVDELIRRMALLESPQEKIATGPSGMQEGEGRLLTKITDKDRGFGYKGIFPEEMHWRSNPALEGGSFQSFGKGGQRYGSTPEVVGPYVESPEYQNILFAEKSKYYHDALNALERIPGDLPSAKKLASFIGRDEWKVYDPEYEPDVSKKQTLAFKHTSFEDVDASLDALKKYTNFTEDSTAVDTSRQGIPSAWFDRATEPFDSTFVEDLF